jgi:hypothetical protein
MCFPAKGLVVFITAFLVLTLSACSGTAPVAPRSSNSSAASSAGALAPTSATVNPGKVPFNVQAEGQFDLLNSSTQPVKVLGAPRVTMLEGC